MAEPSARGASLGRAADRGGPGGAGGAGGGPGSRRGSVDFAARRVVLKVGTSSLINEELGTVNISRLASICETAAQLKARGWEVVLVSSGAVGVGRRSLALDQRPKSLWQKQALAAVGQGRLMRYYDDNFATLNLTCAQVLLTLENLAVEGQYRNVLRVFQELFALGVVPIVNENDTVAYEELKFGDNDTLSAQVACLVHAQWLFLLTDVDALYTANPQTDPDATAIRVVDDISALDVDAGNSSGSYGTGGMATKLTAARLAAAGGCHTVICLSSTSAEDILKIMDGQPEVGTVFKPLSNVATGRKRWILGVPSKGKVRLDAGAIRALLKKKSLFAAGIVGVEMEWGRFDAVELCNEEGVAVAKGLVNYNSQEVAVMQGCSSAEAQKKLGDEVEGPDEVAFRGNIVLYESIITSPIGSFEDTTHIALMERSVRNNSCPALDAIAEAGATHPDL